MSLGEVNGIQICDPSCSERLTVLLSNFSLMHVIMVGELPWPNASALMDLDDLSVVTANHSVGQSNVGAPLRENSVD